VIKRILLVATLAVPLSAVLPHAKASTPKAPAAINASAPMFCVWNQQLDISYCQYTLPRIP
jgi:hypothetical protein